MPGGVSVFWVFITTQAVERSEHTFRNIEQPNACQGPTAESGKVE
jgi:hypothetical protein